MSITVRKPTEITEQAVREARQVGLYGETHKRLARMVRAAAPITHPYGNRRFHDFILDINEGKILRVSRV